MPLGPGKYDDLCTIVREKAEAKCVLVLIVDGNKGEGFSVQAVDESYAAAIPDMLRNMADAIENRR